MLREALGPLTGKLRQLIAVLELTQIEATIGPFGMLAKGGRPRMSGQSAAPLWPKRSTT
jgi:hypothetical protein